MDFSIIQKITEEEYDGDLDTYENKLKLYKRLDKELEGTDRVFLKIFSSLINLTIIPQTKNPTNVGEETCTFVT